MLIDTGADNIVLPFEFLEFFGHEVSDCMENTARLYGIGEVTCYQVPNNLLFCFHDIEPERTFENRVFFSHLSRDFGLLGREILNRMRICFTHDGEYAYYLNFID